MFVNSFRLDSVDTEKTVNTATMKKSVLKVHVVKKSLKKNL